MTSFVQSSSRRAGSGRDCCALSGHKTLGSYVTAITAVTASGRPLTFRLVARMVIILGIQVGDPQLIPSGAVGKAVEQNLVETVPRETVWYTRRVEVEQSNGNPG